MVRVGVVLSVLLLLGSSAADAYRASLISTSSGDGGAEGVVTITDADGKVHVAIDGVTDPAGALLDNASVQLRLHVNGRRRRVKFPFPLVLGAGDATWSLDLKEGDRVIINDLRVATPHGKTVARAGVVAVPLAYSDPLPTDPPVPVECGEAFELCQIDLTYCEEELDFCDAQMP